jgi:uncharacterized membrane protein
LTPIKGTVHPKPQPEQRTIVRFLKYRDLFIVDALTVILILNVLLAPDFPLRLVIGALFVLFLPGYTLVSALFPKRRDLGHLERGGLSMGLSLAVVPLIGLALNYTSWGIRLQPLLLFLSAFNILMSMAAYWRRERLPPSEAFNPPIPLSYFSNKWQGLNLPDKRLMVGFLVCLTAVGGAAVHFASTPGIDERFTEFYVLGSNGKIADYPTNLTLGESGDIIIGVLNQEYQSMNYTVIVKLENQTLATYKDLYLDHEEKWEQNYAFTPNQTGEKLKLHFLLTKQGDSQPYGELQLWTTVKPLEN